ncbi:MAG TPA: hypothetical protein ACFYEK_11010 [Candidatus Wunengus sp. YC60]|uniref:hypothetical protein n=1 Tax=Candidatus Wunengus sp. YC60 TaxID=3367697 RepID=UPI0040252B4F
MQKNRLIGPPPYRLVNFGLFLRLHHARGGPVIKEIMYGKIFTQFFDSSIMDYDISLRYIWIAMITISDADGFLDMTKEALARRIDAPLDDVKRAIDEFTKPDLKSRSKEEEGRRLVPIRESFGWKIINKEKYRLIISAKERAEYMRKYMSQYREQQRIKKERNPNPIIPTTHPEPLDEPGKENYEEELLKETDEPLNIETIKKEGNENEEIKPPPQENINIKVSDFIKIYCEQFKKRYNDYPQITGKARGIAQRLVQDMGLEKTKKLVINYLKMNDKWFLEKAHSLDAFECNLNKIHLFSQPISIPDRKLPPEKEALAKREEIRKQLTPEEKAELKINLEKLGIRNIGKEITGLKNEGVE